jgi:anti-sigma B factor antagonist
MNVEQTSAGEVQIFRITGRLDSTTAPAFEAQVLPTVRPGSNRIVFDFTAVDYVSSAGLRTVLLAAKQTRATQGGFAIFGMSPAIFQVFKMSGFARIIALFDDEAQAVNAARGSP